MKRTDSLFTIFFFLFAFVTSLTFAQSITVNAKTYKQTINLMGGDMERSSFAVQNAINKQEIIDWGFKDIAFNSCRVQFDKNQELVEGTKNWIFYDKQVATMKAIKLINPSIKFFATMRSDYDGYGDANNMPDWIVNYTTKVVNTDKYGVFLADYIQYMSQQGIAISYLSISKEWAAFINADKAKLIINKLNSELTARGIAKPLIADPASWSISQGITYVNRVSALGSKGLYAGFCSHDYQNEGTTKWATFVANANALGKSAWNDETSAGAGGPTSGVEVDITVPIAVYIEKCVAYNSGLQGEIFFEIWSRGINKETRAIYFPNNGTGVRMRGYYIMKQFANSVKDNKYITSSITSMTGVSTMAFRIGNKVNLWVINNSSTSFSSKPVVISGATISGSVSKIYWTATNPIEGKTATPTSNTTQFWATTDANSISCYTFNVIDTKSVSINENELGETSSINVFSNLEPESFTLNIKGLNSPSFELYDLSGKIVMKEKQLNASTQVSTDQLAKGIYMLKVRSENESFSKKIIVK